MHGRLFIIFSIILLVACTPPRRSLRERYINDTPELKPDVRQAILDGDIIIGMTSEQVYASRATPIFKGEKVLNDRMVKYWVYPDMKDSPFVNIYFYDDAVIEIERTDREPPVE